MRTLLSQLDPERLEWGPAPPQDFQRLVTARASEPSPGKYGGNQAHNECADEQREVRGCRPVIRGEEKADQKREGHRSYGDYNADPAHQSDVP
jgi:hypothetical protein